jgi:hypothetical protein
MGLIHEDMLKDGEHVFGVRYGMGHAVEFSQELVPACAGGVTDAVEGCEEGLEAVTPVRGEL